MPHKPLWHLVRHNLYQYWEKNGSTSRPQDLTMRKFRFPKASCYQEYTLHRSKEYISYNPVQVTPIKWPTVCLLSIYKIQQDSLYPQERYCLWRIIHLFILNSTMLLLLPKGTLEIIKQKYKWQVYMNDPTLLVMLSVMWPFGEGKKKAYCTHTQLNLFSFTTYNSKGFTMYSS